MDLRPTCCLHLFYMARTLPEKAKVITNPKEHEISNILKKSMRWGLCLYITKSSGYTKLNEKYWPRFSDAKT